MKIKLVILSALFVSLLGFKSPKEAKVTHKLLLSFAVDGQELKRKITVGLFGRETPKTAANFFHLCKGSYKDEANRKLSIVGSPFHRIIPKFMIQGGDFTAGNGTGGRSIYGAKFEDENFSVATKPGVLAMANSGPNTNGSQFFITTGDTQWLDGKHVVFGRVLKGMPIVKFIEGYGSQGGETSSNIKLSNCQFIWKAKI